jgi:hypothetical protein
MNDETPPHGIERSAAEHPANKSRPIRSVQSRNQPPLNPFRFKDSSNAEPTTEHEPETDTDPTEAGGIERTINTGRKTGIVKPTLKLRVIKGGKED